MTKPKATILYIENEPEMIELVRLILNRNGYDLISATDGQTGLDLLNEHVCDLVLLDLMMPGMDGWEVFRRMQGTAALKSIPVIVITAKAQPQDRDFGLRVNGVHAYVTKPFALRALLATVEDVLAGSMPHLPQMPEDEAGGDALDD